MSNWGNLVIFDITSQYFDITERTDSLVKETNKIVWNTIDCVQ